MSAALRTFIPRKVLVCTGIAALILPILACVVAMPSVRAQSATAPIPKWDVISIKPCDAPSANASSGTPPASFSPVRMTLNCQQVLRLIRDAYLLFRDAQPPMSRYPFSVPIEGLPDWTRKQLYTIEASADGNATPEMMAGPMLQALLEDRFHLKLHHETRDVPIYDLVVAEGGPKLTPFVEGSCVPPQVSNMLTGLLAKRPQLPAGQRYCQHGGGITPNSPNLVINDDATTLDLFCKNFLGSVGEDGRPVIDKTGLTGKYTIHLEYAPSDATRQGMRLKEASPEPTAPEIFTAIQEQLGLKLVPDNGPDDFIVVDHIDPPSAN